MMRVVAFPTIPVSRLHCSTPSGGGPEGVLKQEQAVFNA
jgi:hypothetical protein